MISKLKKENYKNLLIFIITVILIVGLVYLFNVFNNKEDDSIPNDYNELISTNTEKSNMHVKVTIADKPYEVAEREYNSSVEKYYILYDSYDYMYVAKLSNKKYDEIMKQYNSNPNNFSYELTGYTYETPSELKNIIIDEFNKSYEDSNINSSNFERYFGTTYLDDSYTKYTPILAIIEVSIGILMVCSLIYLFKFIVSLINTNKNLSKFNISDIDTDFLLGYKEYKKVKIYLSSKYLISTYKGLHIYSISDIFWTYLDENNSTNKKVFLVIVNRNREKYNCKKISSLKTDEYINLINEISKMNPNILIGYTYENIEKYNNRYC